MSGCGRSGGLARRKCRFVPSLAGVRRSRLLAMQHHLDAMGIRVLRHKGQGQAFARLREYVRGDDPRHIDWKGTSKRGKFITREFTVERSQTVITLLDAGRGMTQLSGEFSRFEHALSAALILTDVASSSGDRVGTLVRDAFIPVYATSREPDYASSFRFLAAHHKAARIGGVLHRHDRRACLAGAAGSCRAQCGAASTEPLFERAAAEEVIQAREAALERMRRAGVVVLDVSPQTMTAGVVNRYLELKARGAR